MGMRILEAIRSPSAHRKPGSTTLALTMDRLASGAAWQIRQFTSLFGSCRCDGAASEANTKANRQTSAIRRKDALRPWHLSKFVTC
jgi:hypothetical protein